MKFRNAIINIFLNIFIIILIFLGYIYSRDRVSVFVYTSSLFCWMFISIILHEIGHTVCILKRGYKLLYVRFWGVQISFLPLMKIDVSGTWLFDSTVMGDYFKNINSDENLQKFFDDFKYIILAGPFVNVIIIVISSILGFVNGFDVQVVLLLLCNCVILVTSMTNSNNCYGDLYLIKFFDLLKDEIIIAISSQLYICTNYIDVKKLNYLIRIINKGKMSDREMIFLMSYLWDKYLNKKSDCEIIEVLMKRLLKIQYTNIYLYYKLLCVFAVVM